MTVGRATRRRLLAVVALLGFFLVCGAPPAASGESETVQSTPAVESWFIAAPPEATAPGCLPTVGCLPPLSLPVFPADTLHVALTLGTDMAHTFLALDTESLPPAVEVAGGVLTLPVITDPLSGSLRPEGARLLACAATEPIVEARGGAPTDAPSFDCTQSSTGRYNAAAQPPVFTFDLRFLSDALQGPGLAIVPSTSARFARDTFRVVFPTAANASASQIAASIQLTASAGTNSPGATDFDPGANPPFDSGRLSPGATARIPNLPPFAADTGLPTPSVEAPAAPSGVATLPLPLSAGGRYAYPAIWLAPFAVIGLATAVSRALTEPIVIDTRRGTSV